MGRKGSAYGTTRASGLDNGADVSDAVKESETAMFGRPKKLKKGRNRRIETDEMTPLATAKAAATVSEEVDVATEKSSINQTRSQKQTKERKERYRGKRSGFSWIRRQ